MMKRIVQTTTTTANNRKVYGATSQQTVNSPDMNPMNSAVRKIHNLLSSGAVTVTGPNQPRILKQKVGTTVVSSTTNSTNNVQQNNNSIMGRCYICDDATNGTQNQMLTDMVTSHTSTKFPNKIGQLVGDAFMVIVSVEDVVCPRCNNLINYLDRLENDVERVRNNIMNLLHKKYGLNDESSSSTAASAATNTTISNSSGVVSQTTASASPPIKMQKLNSGNAAVNRVSMNDDGADGRNRKVSTVQQMKITPPQIQQQQQQQLQKKTTKLYKCLSCDFKTSDLKLFNPHYETCKQQNFQCKICKKLFANLAAMKQHMTEKHGATATTPSVNSATANTIQQSNEIYSCQHCQVNFTSELALKKHMEVSHNEYKQSETTTQLYTCNHCQYKSTDKSIFDEHMRKHVKPKPFKCRLCSTRFETREQATIHAKAHQPNYFKCGTCSLSFPKREMLVKHFEVHQTKPQQQQQQTQQVTQIITQQQQQQTTQSQPHMMTTQKLLQETIDEALSESAEAGVDSKAIRFFTCHICSLTFIQENYYNQHMETHKPQSQKKSMSASMSAVTSAGISTTASTTSASVSQSLIRGEVKDSNDSSNLVSTGGTIESDIESIFEKMHSEKSDNDVGAGAAGGDSAAGSGDNLVITSQENAVGGITFNITIPQPDAAEQDNEAAAKQQQQQQRSGENSTAPVSVSIDMPVLDHLDEGMEKNASSADGGQPGEKQSASGESEKKAHSPPNSSGSAAHPVSMPSLDDDNEGQDSNSQHSTATLEQQNQQESSIAGSGNQESEDQQEGQQQQQQGGDQGQDDENQQNIASGEQVPLDLEEMQAGVEGGQIKFILNENGQLLQLDNHIITDSEGNQILVQGTDSEQIQQLLQSVGVLQTSDGLDGETLQMIGDNNQMVIVQQGDNEPQLIDASLLNADGHIVIQQGQDGELGEGAHVIGEGGVRIPVSVSYTADGQPIVQVTQHPDNVDGKDMDGTVITTTAGGETAVTQSLSQAAGSFFALEDLMQQSEQQKASE